MHMHKGQFCLSSVVITKITRHLGNKQLVRVMNKLKSEKKHSSVICNILVQPMSVTNSILSLAIVPTPIDRAHCRPGCVFCPYVQFPGRYCHMYILQLSYRLRAV